MNRVGNYLNITTMCLITNQKEPEILEEDLIVFKVLKDNLKSPLQGFRYSKNKLYENEIEESEDPSFADNESQNLYDKGGLSMQEVLEIHDLKALGKGFHSITTEKRALSYINQFYSGYLWFKVFSCIIPKGSEIYRDATGLIISNKLIIKERITL